jgi:hypothetical protein
MSNRLIFTFKIIDHTNDAISVKFIEVAEFPIPTEEQPVSAVFFPLKNALGNYLIGYAPLKTDKVLPLMVKIEIKTSDGKINTFYDWVEDDINSVHLKQENEIKTYTRKGIVILNKISTGEYVASVNMVIPSYYALEENY